MEKDAFYFPHFSNARSDRKLRRIRKELGIEGYGIYFMVLEVLRDQENFIFPLEDIDLLADEFGTSEAKVRTVVCNYKLFEIDEEQNFFSTKFNKYLEPYLENKHRSRINGIKGSLKKHYGITSKEIEGLTDSEVVELQQSIKVAKGAYRGATRGSLTSKVKKSKVKERKESKTNKDNLSVLFLASNHQTEQFKTEFNHYIQMRKDIKAKMTDRAIELAIKKLNEYDEQTAIKMLENSIANSWKGLFEIKAEQKKEIVPQPTPYRNVAIEPTDLEAIEWG